jgi:hypothetical protein
MEKRMKKPATNKIHATDDCPNFNYRMEMSERLERVSSDLTKTTCGQCKGQILNVLRDKDWSKLTAEELSVLQSLAVFANFIEE